MSVSEYRTQLMQLLRFIEGEFPTERMFKGRFENGLRDNIKIQLAIIPMNTVSECAEIAMDFESRLDEAKSRS